MKTKKRDGGEVTFEKWHRDNFVWERNSKMRERNTKMLKYGYLPYFLQLKNKILYPLLLRKPFFLF